MCRERRSQFAFASRQVSAAVRGSRVPARSRLAGRGVQGSNRRLAYLTGVLILSAIGLAVSEMRIRAASHAASLAACADSRPEPCRPDLPNDTCR
jgi:hypothetical protein